MKALHYTLTAGDFNLAASQMKAGLHKVVNLEDRLTLERWLRLLPEEMVQRDPWLLMIRVWALEFIWRLDLQAQVLQQVDELLELEVSNLPDGGGAANPTRSNSRIKGAASDLNNQNARRSTYVARHWPSCHHRGPSRVMER